MAESSRIQRRIGGGLTLLLGGARSGKSELVVSLGRQSSTPVTFVATAEAHDDDMAKRIRAHQDDRPDTWDLLELPELSTLDVEQIASGSLVIVDCLTLLVSNLMLAGESQGAITDHVDALASALAARREPALVVSNEVGLGIHPATEMGATYRDTLGAVNKSVARHANDVLFVIAGRVLPLADLELTLGPNSEARHNMRRRV